MNYPAPEHRGRRRHLHRVPRAPQQHRQGLLVDGVGAERQHHRHAPQDR